MHYNFNSTTCVDVVRLHDRTGIVSLFITVLLLFRAVQRDFDPLVPEKSQHEETGQHSNPAGKNKPLIFFTGSYVNKVSAYSQLYTSAHCQWEPMEEGKDDDYM
jgi:hypothetical protein